MSSHLQAPSRGVTVHLDVPSGVGYPDTAQLVDLADTLHELAQELLPGATANTEVTLTPAPAPAADQRTITVDMPRRRVEAGGEVVQLARAELELLGHLALRAGQVVSAARLSAVVWNGRPETTGENSVDVSVRRVRRRLAPHGLVLVSVPGTGYRLDSPVTLRRDRGHTTPHPRRSPP